MIGRVKEALLQEQQYQQKTGMFCVAQIDGMSNFIFGNRFGNIHNPQAVNRAIKRIVDDYNAKEVISARREGREPVILPRFSCHITRHTFCSRLCENDVNVKAIQEIMGHSDIQTTLDIYAEITSDKKKTVLYKLEEDDVL